MVGGGGASKFENFFVNFPQKILMVGGGVVKQKRAM